MSPKTSSPVSLLDRWRLELPLERESENLASDSRPTTDLQCNLGQESFTSLLLGFLPSTARG